MSRAGTLELWEVNTGSRYRERCAIARQAPRFAARRMVDIACTAAREVERVEECAPFSAADIIEAAGLLLAYYERHNAESDALAAADAAGGAS